jgi:hypothetical protein
MSKVRYSATFVLPDGGQFTITRGSRMDYGYTVAWAVLRNGWAALPIEERFAASGFSRTRENAEKAAAPAHRLALYAPVTKGGAA